MRLPLISLLLATASGVAAAEDIRILLPNQSDFRLVAEDVINTVTYKPLAPAEAGGIIGLEVGAIASYVPVEDKQAWKRLTGLNVSELIVVGGRVLKGLPLNIDVGAFYTVVPEYDVRIYGAELRYAILPGSTVMPALALRGAYTAVEGIGDFDVRSSSLDLSLSKGFAMVTPYLGAGYVWGVVDPDPQTTLKKENVQKPRVFGGVRVTLGPLYLTPEISAMDGNPAYSVNTGFGF